MYSAVYKSFTSRIYVFGGLYSSPDFEAEVVYDDIKVLLLNLMRFQKLSAKNPPPGRYGHSAVLLKWDMYVFGGCRNDGFKKVCLNDVYKINLFNHDKLYWEEQITDGVKPCPRFGHLCLHFGLQMIIYGGRNDKLFDNLFGDLWIFDILKKFWTELKFRDSQLDFRRAFHAGTMFENSLIVFGGKNVNQNPLVDKFIKFDFEWEETN